MKWLAWGFAYGVVLLALFLPIAGAGHGLYFPIAFVNGFAIPLVPALAAWAARYRPRIIFLPLMALHYIAAFILGPREYRAEGDDVYLGFHEKLHDLGPYIAVFAAAYLIGQVLLWRTFAKSSRRQLSSV